MSDCLIDYMQNMSMDQLFKGNIDFTKTSIEKSGLLLTIASDLLIHRELI